MLIELKVIGGPDKEKRFEVVLDEKSCGELQTSREQLTRLADLLFEKNYKISK